MRDGDARGLGRTFIGLLTLVVAIWTVVPAMAQGQPVQLVGRVQWFSSEKMMLIPDDGGLPIEVDITQVPLDNYRTMTAGDWVVVNGVVSPDGRKVIATSIAPAGGS